MQIRSKYRNKIFKLYDKKKDIDSMQGWDESLGYSPVTTPYICDSKKAEKLKY